MAQNLQTIKEAFADYLSKPYWNWSWYCTATFDPSKMPQYKRIAEHSWRFFLSRIADTASISYGFCFSETHRSGATHWHALVHVTENLLGQPQRKDVWKQMFDKYGRNQILPFKASNFSHTIDTMSTGVARYLTKYVAKEAASDQAWWDFGGNISGSEANASQIRSAIGAPMARKDGTF